MQIQDPLEAKQAESERIEASIREIQKLRALEEAQRQADRWDRAMTRAFKGIRSRTHRHNVMDRRDPS